MSRASEDSNRRMLRARDAIDRRYAEPLDVPALARLAHVSEAHFIRTFRATFGETPNRYLQRRRIERAMFLLRSHETTVTDVCMAVGFSSLGTFSRVFTAVVGEPPSVYRRRGRLGPVPTCFAMAWLRPGFDTAGSENLDRRPRGVGQLLHRELVAGPGPEDPRPDRARRGAPRRVTHDDGPRVGAGRPFSYPEVGASAGAPPTGYRHLRVERHLGTGADRFESAVERLMTWDVHRRAGLEVDATAPRVAAGGAAVVSVRLGPWLIAGPVRVVDVVDEPTVKGFAYGTLPGHPESGEERFLVHHDPDDTVRATIRAFSRPARWFSRLGGPVARRLQDRITDRYLDALADVS